MADFDAARQALNAARADHDRARAELAQARAALRQAGAAQRAGERTGAASDRHVAVAQQRVEAAEAGMAAERGRLKEAIGGFGAFSDPRRQVTRLSDAFPCLLFPVRLETRFKTAVDAAGASQPQLWVRIYPDTCSIDTFEATLADVELAAGRAYWQGIWRAGGVEADERAAWRALVASHGSGRAGWIVDSYRPQNEADRPAKAASTDAILVVASEAELPAGDRSALAVFWRAQWLADGNAAAEDAALTALRTAVGAAHADDLVEAKRPYNLDDRPAQPLTKASVASSVAFVVLPPVATKDQPWTQAPRVDLLPDRFVLIAEAGGDRVELLGEPVPSPLLVGPDPFAPPADQIHQQSGDLVMPDELRWMVDFERAVDVGLGFKLDLTPVQASRGFERLFVLGLRLSADELDSKTALETLLDHHRNGRSGLSVLPQGTPTNNTEGTGSGFTRGDDADASFDERLQASLFTPESDPRRKQDGQWLAELLGIDPAALAHVSHAGGLDQRDARAMQTVLWPATLGYFLATMLDPLIGDADIEQTRWFFTNYVSGRGAAPALRIGAQPYGVLPTTAFSRIGWLEERSRAGGIAGSAERLHFLQRLHAMVQSASQDWAVLAGQAPAVEHGGDAHQTLLGILGLHPASVEFHYRYAQSLDHLFNHYNLLGLGGALIAELMRAGFDAPALALLGRLGSDGEGRPAILDLYFDGGQGALLGAVVDDQPLSESEGVRVWTTDGHDYLRWLIDATGTSLDALRVQSGFIDDTPPTAILYLLLRHALMLGYDDAGRELHRSAGFDEVFLRALKREPAFVHVDPQAAVSESRFAALYKNEPAISPGESWTVAAQIAHVLPVATETARLREQVEALELLEGASTARLERALTEHIDCCSNRLDAWQLGLVQLQLERMRGAVGDDAAGGDGATRPGLYLGAYGWLENVRPKARELTPVELPADLATVFDAASAPAIVHDSTSGGFIHAPSLNQAVTAAVLRSGYLANASADSPDTLAVNLSSDRVRVALGVLEGIRNGQSLASLLGYRFERGLHDDYAVAAVDQFVFALRKAFPLRADRLSSTATDDGVPIKAIEARNVVDGLRLVEHVQQTGSRAYPFGLTALPAATAAQSSAIDSEIDRLLDVHDALADLALAEGVHQAVQGNFDRVGATLATYTTGQYPPEPDVVRTPATGVTLTHRVGLHLQPGLGPPAVDATPCSIAEPAVNRWLRDVLPPLDQIACRVVWQNPVTSAPASSLVTMAHLGLQPLDLLALIRTADAQAMTELDDRIVRRVLEVAAPRPDADLQIQYMEHGPSHFSVFQVAPQVAHLRSLLVGARPLRPADAALPNETNERANDAVSADRTRVDAVQALADALVLDLGAYLTGLEPLLADQPNRRPDVLAGIDGFLDSAVALLARGARLGVTGAGWGFALAWRRAQYAGLVALLRQRVKQWQAKLDDFDARLHDYDLLPGATSVDERFRLLQQAEGLIATSLDPLPANPGLLRTALDAKRIPFATRHGQLAAIAEGASATLSDLLAQTQSALPLTQFDAEPFDLTDLEDRVILCAGDLATAIGSLRDRVGTRSAAATEQLTASAVAAAGPARVQAVQQAARALLGDDFVLVPEFTLAPAQGDEWEQALGASADLLQYLEDETEVDFPVDEWLYGVARVRPPMRHLEQATLLAGALDTSEPELTPIQFPYRSGERWLALEFPHDQTIDGDRLLYTACYSVAFAKAGNQCGLLLDEWTEVVPGATATTGLSFNYDQPSSEAPQTMLLVTPATWDGSWQWDDLTGALSETLELAKLRAVEPVHVDGTAYARFLPATVMAATLYGISIATTLAANNQVYKLMKADEIDA